MFATNLGTWSHHVLLELMFLAWLCLRIVIALTFDSFSVIQELPVSNLILSQGKPESSCDTYFG